MAGGNTSPGTGRGAQLPGCYNGGKLMTGPGAKSNGLRESVSPRECIEKKCRWCATGPAFLDELRAKFQVKAHILSGVEDRRAKVETRIEKLKDSRYDAESKGLPFSPAELDRETMVLQKYEVEKAHIDEQMGNVLDVVKRCVELLRETKDRKSRKNPVVALGTFDDVQIAIDAVQSELVAVSGICLDAEIYPDLATDATPAILRRSQLLDQFLLRQPGQTPLMLFDRELQLEIGNSYTENLIAAQEAELHRRKMDVPQGKHMIMKVALEALQSGVERTGAPPIYLRNALKLKAEKPNRTSHEDSLLVTL